MVLTLVRPTSFLDSSHPDALSGGLRTIVCQQRQADAQHPHPLFISDPTSVTCCLYRPSLPPFSSVLRLTGAGKCRALPDVPSEIGPRPADRGISLAAGDE
jgi:hypothetical protein